MSNITLRCTPRQARKMVIECIQAGLVPFLQSSPGMGKSSIVHQIGEDFRLQLVDHRLSSSEPTDLSGFGMRNERGRASYVPFDLFPLEGDPLPEGKEGWLLFFDELNAAPRSVQAAAYKILLDRMIGQHRLHSHVAMVAAGNLASDRAITNHIGTAMQSRLVHLELEANFEEWLEDVALKRGYDQRIIAFLSQYPSKLMDFRPDHQDKTFCCPRTWEFVNRLIQRKEMSDTTAILLAGTITSGVAAEFVQFTKVFQNLISIREVLADPANCRIPADVSSRWATITHLMEAANEDNFGDLTVYANRFDLSFRILFYRMVNIRHPQLKLHPAYGPAMVEISRYMHAA